MRIYPAVHYTMGGLWVDYDLQTTVPGLFAIGEANFSDHGANRLGASALMQGLADGYFVLPSTINDYLARNPHQRARSTPRHPAVAEVLAETEDRLQPAARRRRRPHPRLLPPRTRRTHVGVLRHGPHRRAGCARRSTGSRRSARSSGGGSRCPAPARSSTSRWRRPTAIVDYLELAELMCLDALHRAESCGGHFREESQTPDGEAARRDEEFSYAAAWEFTGTGAAPVLHKEDLVFEYVHPTQRSYA